MCEENWSARLAGSWHSALHVLIPLRIRGSRFSEVRRVCSKRGSQSVWAMARIRSSIPRRVIPAHITLTVVEAVNLLAASILVLLFLGGFLTLAWKSKI